MHDLIRGIYSKLGHREVNLFTFLYIYNFRLAGNASMIDCNIRKRVLLDLHIHCITVEETEKWRGMSSAEEGS